MSIGYTWEKLHVAVTGLTTSADDLPTRLAEAYVYHLMRLTPEDFPPDLQDRFGQFVAQVTRWEPQGQGLVPVVADNMGMEEARQLIEEVVSLYDAITRRLPEDRR